jgi:ribonuclease R
MSRKLNKKQKEGYRDPHAKREADRYERPIASRELLLKVIEDLRGPVTLEHIAEALKLERDEEREALRRRLRAMERDGQVVRNRRDGYLPVNHRDLISGRVQSHPDGFGFLIPDQGGDDVFLPAREMRVLLHGDRAVVSVVGVDRRGRPEGRVVEVLERAHHRVVGRLFRERGIGFVVPDNRRIAQDILVPPDAWGGARDGQIALVEITAQPTAHSQPIGRVVQVLGDHMAPGMEVTIAINSHDLPHAWPEEVEALVDQIPETVPERDKRGRIDLRDVPLVTIDGADARDFDDAVYCEARAGGWRLLVAIADVSHYVRPDSPLDEEARRRGTSVYFPGEVIPMLPEVLSNGLCSLNPDVDRLCMVCEMSIDADGKVTRSRFYEAVMRSHARLTYAEVARIVVEKDSKARRRRQALLPQLEELHALYRALAKARRRRGALDFEAPETKIVFGEGRKIAEIVPLHRNDAHKIIEECMIAANVCAARFLKRHKLPTLYRVHEGPNPDKLEDLIEFLREMGLRLAGGARPEPRHFASVIKRIQDRPDSELIQTVMLRSLMQAVYSPNNVGHFGLALEDYCHFTSPIRRYPDLLVHRGIRHVLGGGKAREFTYRPADMQSLGEHCSATERRADEATRDAEEWLKCEFMVDKIGEEYEGIITGVTAFGIFIQLKELHVEGMVHVTNLERDFYEFDPIGHRLIGERSGQVFRLADSLRVKVARVDLDDRKIDFDVVRPPATPRTSRRGGGATRRSRAGGKGRKVRRASTGRRRR